MIVVAIAGWLLLSSIVIVGWKRLDTSMPFRIGLLSLTLAFSLVHQLLYSTVAEDAFITFRYSANLADGNGPVFNVGERAEGYSNFLWMVLIAAPKAIFGADIVLTASVFGVLCTLGCVVASYFLVNRVVGRAGGTRPCLGLAAAVVTAGAASLAAYGPSGLETPLFVLLILLMCHALVADRFVIAGVLVALATMTRPDGFVFAALAGALLLFAAVRKRASWWAPIGYGAAALVLALPWTVWRVTYYGYLLPNAVAAKSGGSLEWQLAQGADYLAEFLTAHSAFIVLAAAAIAALTYRGRISWRIGDAKATIWFIFGLAMAYLVFVAATGGDWMPAWRMFAPVPVLIAVGLAATYGVLTAETGSPSPRPKAADRQLVVPAVACSLCGLSLLVTIEHPSTLHSMHGWRAKILEMKEIGDWFGGRLPEGTVISTYANGALSYSAGSKFTVVDVLGLTDEHIARQGKRTESAGPIGHIANDYDYVANDRKPDVAVMTGNGYSGGQECGIHDAFKEKYRVATFRRVGSGQWISVYPRRTEADRVIASLDADPRFSYVPCAS